MELARCRPLLNARESAHIHKTRYLQPVGNGAVVVIIVVATTAAIVVIVAVIVESVAYICRRQGVLSPTPNPLTTPMWRPVR